MDWAQKIDLGLRERQGADAYRQRRAITDGNHRLLEYQGRRYLNFSSNDYLGLARDPRIVAAWQQGAARHGVGSGGSGHVTGHSACHQALEQRLADWLGYERALLFTSGYAANQGAIAALAGAGDQILADKLSHASLLEAAAHSPAQLRRFHHNDAASLARLAQTACAGGRLAVTEGVFSMDGDAAPLPSLHQAIRDAGGWLLVDDAHGFGAIGEQGRGSAWQQGCHPELLVVTFGKAVGVGGAAVLCARPVAEYLLQFARHLIYSTALPPAQVCAINASLDAIVAGDELRARLRRNIARFRHGAAELGYPLGQSGTAIQPLLVGDNALALRLGERLREQGCWLTAIRPPTVPPGGARLRITLTAAHHEADIDALLEALDHAHGYA
ncbi:8-amino-7-oxononanoate synthase [Acerihabitans arboris]|uniref:8-amino-7-oxononanoate synthase n=1 Tax=Acerihabitans arboris TaxID=2691583 RepID=A0A845SJK5_9GAMM|nr:8-amino-7-oxononanoate synthase [Acerihabitans arboris]NDL62798.1 8-amino-7-oxononanoate synthase [Acerihabitans arboris]